MSNLTLIPQYIGRLYDVLAYRDGTSSGEVELDQHLVDTGSGGEICTGIQKLAQRYLLELLTETGSMQYQPVRGCDFMIEARSGYWQSSLDVNSSFSSAKVDIAANLRAEESLEDSDDEKYKDAELINVQFVPGYANITIRLTSQAGSTREFITPIDIVV
jgi:hypothetical protein